MPYSASINWYRFARLYTLFLVVLAGMLRLKGENWWLSSFLIFAPPHLWILPWFLLLYGVKKAGPRFLLPLGAALVVWAFGVAGFSLGLGARSPRTGAETLTVVTNNVSENNDQSIRPFVEANTPDLVLYQDYYRLRHQPIDFEGFHSRVFGRHVLMSRYPIVAAKPISGVAWRRSAGVVFTIDWKGQPVNVYSIHIPTARPDFLQLWKGKAALGERFRAYRSAMKKRVEIGEKLAKIMAEDPLPVVAAGDFNMPSWGYLRRHIASHLSDAFGVAGRGFGYTFPGFDPYLPTWFGTWLRLDYVFSNAFWTPISAKVEGGRASQHRAVVAKLEWTPPAVPTAPSVPAQE